MAKDFFQSYELGSAKERAEIIYENYCSFEAIIEDFKAGLIYDGCAFLFYGLLDIMSRSWEGRYHSLFHFVWIAQIVAER